MGNCPNNILRCARCHVPWHQCPFIHSLPTEYSLSEITPSVQAEQARPEVHGGAGSGEQRRGQGGRRPLHRHHLRLQVLQVQLQQQVQYRTKKCSTLQYSTGTTAASMYTSHSKLNIYSLIMATTGHSDSVKEGGICTLNVILRFNSHYQGMSKIF